MAPECAFQTGLVHTFIRLGIIVATDEKEEKSLLQLMDEAMEEIEDPKERTEYAYDQVEKLVFSKLKPIGLQAIDGQHAMLVQHLCNLYQVMLNLRIQAPSNKDTALLNISLLGLKNYTIKHFQEEENYMLYIGYPDLDEHVNIHKDFTAKFLEIQSDIQNGQIQRANDLFFMVYNWLFDHINLVDAKIAQFYRPN
ncbi:MAG: hemerythrin family protein [Magnetococcales bacterium]|nr:hemerythrin family protein [Magnetococcales bacterium]